jgi:hypothetical protein
MFRRVDTEFIVNKDSYRSDPAYWKAVSLYPTNVLKIRDRVTDSTKEVLNLQYHLLHLLTSSDIKNRMPMNKKEISKRTKDLLIN